MRIRIVTISCAITFVMGSVCFMPQSYAGGAPTGTSRVDPKDSDLPLLHSNQARAISCQAQNDAAKEVVTNIVMKPEVSALIKQSTAIYSAMKSYKHISEYVSKGQSQNGEVNRTQTYTLALERPNKFCYKSDRADGSVAVCDGKTFINHRNDDNNENDNAAPENKHTYYTKTLAPASYKGINIVDDVTFNYGTYMIALMLQGDVLADSEVRDALTHTTLKAGVSDNGKKYDLLTIPFMGRPVNFYFDATSHLLHKTVETQQEGSNPRPTDIKYTEIIENVLIDKPLPASLFEYTPPKTSRLIVSLLARAKSQVATASHAAPAANSGRTLVNIGASF